MSDEEVRELIAEARRLIAHCRTYNFGMWSADKLAHEVAGELADALEATLQPVESKNLSTSPERDKNGGDSLHVESDEREALIEIARAYVIVDDDPYAIADSILAAGFRRRSVDPVALADVIDAHYFAGTARGHSSCGCGKPGVVGREEWDLHRARAVVEWIETQN